MKFYVAYIINASIIYLIIKVFSHLVIKKKVNNLMIIAFFLNALLTAMDFRWDVRFPLFLTYKMIPFDFPYAIIVLYLSALNDFILVMSGVFLLTSSFGRTDSPSD